MRWFSCLRRRKALTDAGEQVPNPFQIRALIDTGASHSCVDPEVLDALNLQPTGTAQTHTPSTGDAPQEIFVYDVALLIPAPDGVPFYRPTLAVGSCTLFKTQGFHALIGRDVLATCILSYNGATKLFTLAY